MIHAPTIVQRLKTSAEHTPTRPHSHHRLKTRELHALTCPTRSKGRRCVSCMRPRAPTRFRGRRRVIYMRPRSPTLTVLFLFDLDRSKFHICFGLDLSHSESNFDDPIVFSIYLNHSGLIRTVEILKFVFQK